MNMSVDEIREPLKGTPRVLLVEGEDDKKTDQLVYEAWLKCLARDVGSGTVPSVVTSGSKSRVVRQLTALRPEVDAGKVYAIVDRDEWDDTDTTAQLAATPGRCVNLDRHCIESYFCDPAELGIALALSSVANSDRAAKAIAKAVSSGLADWVGHWALWTTLERLKNRMSGAAYPNAFHQGITPPSDKVVKAKLQEWEEMIDVDQIMRNYRALRKASWRRPEAEQLRSRSYAKNVFPQVVLVELNKLNVEIASDEWMPQLANWLPEVPQDIRVILQPLIV